MPEITTGTVSALLELGLDKVWTETLTATPETWKAWLSTRVVERITDTQRITSGLGAVSEVPPGSAFETDTVYVSTSKSFELKFFGLAVTIQHAVLKYEWYNVVKPLGSGLAKSARNKYEVYAYELFNRAFDTNDSIYTDIRGETLCATAHARLDGGTWKNRSSTDVGLSMDGLETAWEDMKRLVNHRGFYQDPKPRRLVVPTELMWLARTLTQSQYDPDNAHLSYNNAKAMGLDIVDTNYISDTFFWFVLAEKDTYKIKMGLGEAPDLKTFVTPATRSVMSNSLCSFRMEVVEGMGIWGSRGQ